MGSGECGEEEKKTRGDEEYCIIALHTACTDMFGIISDLFGTMTGACRPLVSPPERLAM